MALNWNDEKIKEKANEMVQYLTEILMSEEIIPLDFVSGIDDKLDFFDNQLKTNIRTVWNEKNSKLDEAKQRDIQTPLRIVKVPTKFTTDDKLRLFLPEEKIIFNQTSFRTILDSVNFDNLSQQTERQILSRLKMEAIGLNEQEILIYYNLIKYSKIKDGSESPQLTEEEENENLHLHASEIVNNIEKEIYPLEKLRVFNEQKPISSDFAISAIIDKVQSRTVSLDVLRLVTGSFESNKLILKLTKNFLNMISDNWGVHPDETFSHYLTLFLFSGSRSNIIKSETISHTLQNFILQDITKLKSVIVANIKFINLFTIILASQLLDINKKFHSVSSDQKEKLFKLYASSERQSMVIANASNFALRKVECIRSDSFDVTKNAKYILNKYQNILNTDILFKAQYI